MLSKISICLEALDSAVAIPALAAASSALPAVPPACGPLSLWLPGIVSLPLPLAATVRPSAECAVSPSTIIGSALRYFLWIIDTSSL